MLKSYWNTHLLQYTCDMGPESYKELPGHSASQCNFRAGTAMLLSKPQAGASGLPRSDYLQCHLAMLLSSRPQQAQLPSLPDRPCTTVLYGNYCHGFLAPSLPQAQRPDNSPTQALTQAFTQPGFFFLLVHRLSFFSDTVPRTSLWKPCLVTSPIPTQFCSCSVTSDRNTSSVIIVLTMSFLVFVFLEYTDILRGRNLWWVLPMCKEARYDFFIGNCCLTSEFCPTSCERGEAQGGWVIPSSLG